MQTWLSRFQVGGGTKNPRLRFHPILLTAFLTRLHVCVDCADMTKPIPGGWGDQKSSFAILPYFAHCIFDPITRTRRLSKHDLADSGRVGGPKILVCEFTLFCWLNFLLLKGIVAIHFRATKNTNFLILTHSSDVKSFSSSAIFLFLFPLYFINTKTGRILFLLALWWNTD